MFASPIFWQIRYLVTNLTKKNLKSSISELNQVFLIRLPVYAWSVLYDVARSVNSPRYTPGHPRRNICAACLLYGNLAALLLRFLPRGYLTVCGLAFGVVRTCIDDGVHLKRGTSPSF